MSLQVVPTVAITAGPLKFSYPITPLISLDTFVSGESRNVATTSIVYGSMTLWSGTMTLDELTIIVPFDVVAGDITIEKGGSFSMTLPSQMQEGSVETSLVIKTPSEQVPFNAVIAHWPLDSGQ